MESSLKDFWQSGQKNPETKELVTLLMEKALGIRIMAHELAGKLLEGEKLTPEEKAGYRRLVEEFNETETEVVRLHQQLGTILPPITISGLCNIWR